MWLAGERNEECLPKRIKFGFRYAIEVKGDIGYVALESIAIGIYMYNYHIITKTIMILHLCSAGL